MEKSFIEIQKIRQIWVIVLMLFVNAMPIYHVAFESTDFIVILPIIIIVFIDLLLVFIQLKTKIYEKGISYQLFPFHLKEKMVLWDEIAEVNIRKYSPIWEYGGWGYRYSFKNGKAFNISGNMGLQLVLKNGKKILIGTNKPEELSVFLETINIHCGKQ
ncbi:MAG: hypothetical protein K9G64_03670 [Bacteroidia bacterium]|nr:hypothetical protein [Bacteroidia bacterium]